ncbi:uncharacterized protein [Choristoneura fumiferana]|uniref:uncharacterized protein n=1 Tax=Choristoneura fumiferana TaxID=7141 RepID=UPI003D155CD1
MDLSDDSTSSSEGESRECDNGDAISKINNFPEKSRERYLKTYELFMCWRSSKGYQSFSEDVFLSYFKELAETKKASTLLNNYSILRSTVSAHHGVHINNYGKLMSYLKVQLEGHTTKKSKLFTAQDVETFLNNAPDDVYLVMKVALVFGIYGACRPYDLVRLRNRDIQKISDQVMLVNVMRNPKVVDRTFVIQDKYIKLVEKYQALRPPRMGNNDRFFVYYRNGKCTRQYIGKNAIAFFAKKIAVFLKLPDAQLYSGHCFRHAAALNLAQPGANPLIVRQSRGWSTNVDEAEYLDESAAMRLRSADSTHETQDSESPINDAQRPEPSVEDTQYINIPCDSAEEMQQVKVEPSECPDESPSLQSDDRLSDDCGMPPSPRPRSPPPARCPPRTPLVIAAFERRRLRLDEVRARQLHSREMARLRVEERRVDVDRERNETLRRIADVALALLEKTMGNGGVIRH